MIALTAFERRAAHAAFETVFPGPDRGSLPYGIADMDLDGYLDDTLASVPFESALGLRLAFVFLALAPLFFLGRFATLMALGADDRERVVERVYASAVYPIRSTVVMLKAIGALLYCGDARVRSLIVTGTSAPAAAVRESGALVPLRVRPKALTAGKEASRVA
jgi:hypothetical protein